MNFPEEIIGWYLKHKRDLPWRQTTDPYLIWLSEVILQQTRVEQGLPYFNTFAEKYPSVNDFANASEDEILRLWQGLGYYSRARNMHKTAKMVMEDHSGYFPSDYNDLLKLKGVGDYTAAAISSFAASQPHAVVDGNVFRLLARYFGIDLPINSSAGKKYFTALANELLDQSQPGVYNQAMMEFGSQVCRPKNPACDYCPVCPGCEALKKGRIAELPVKNKSSKIRNRYFHYIIARGPKGVLMHKRSENDIWQNLYEPPLFETGSSTDPSEIIKFNNFTELFGNQCIIKSVNGPVKHILSHQHLFATFTEIENFSEQFSTKNGWFFADEQKLESLGMPKLIFQYFKNFVKLKD